MVIAPQELDEQLHEFLRAHRQAMQKFFSSCGMFNGYPFMLFLIRRTPGITPAQLAKEMEIAPASATVSVKRMEAAGLLCREPDEHDRRMVHLMLTPAGEAMDDLCSKGHLFMAETMFAGFTDRELAALSDMLDRMQKNMVQANAAQWLEAHRNKKEDTD